MAKKPTAKEIEHLMKSLDISEVEAVELWKADHDEIVNEEQEELDKKASAVKINKGAGRIKKTGQKKERKPNEDKRNIISILFSTIASAVDENAKVTNIEKYINFEYNGNNYDVSLICHRPTKKSDN